VTYLGIFRELLWRIWKPTTHGAKYCTLRRCGRSRRSELGRNNSGEGRRWSSRLRLVGVAEEAVRYVDRCVDLPLYTDLPILDISENLQMSLA